MSYDMRISEWSAEGSSSDLHLLIFDMSEATTVPDPATNINRFLTGAVTVDRVGSDSSLMTFAKIGRLTIFGIIQKGSHRWEGTKVHIKHGLLKPGKIVIPGALLDLFREKDRKSTRLNSSH